MRQRRRLRKAQRLRAAEAPSPWMQVTGSPPRLSQLPHAGLGYGLTLSLFPEHVELVKRTMAGVKLPTLGIPAWASQISEDQWRDVVQRTLQARQSLGGPRPEWK